MAAPQPQLDYAANVEKYASAVDTLAVKGIVKYLSIALQNRDASLVAASDPEELRRVRDSFMKKKLGLTQPDAELDAALKDVMTIMSSDRNKSRVTVYYLLAEKFGKLGLFANPQGAPVMQPTKDSVSIKQPTTDDIERIQQTYEAIARRAFEIYENNGRWTGTDLGDWLRAESELLYPVRLELTETDEALGVRAEVPGFEARELEINVEPRRLTLWGNHEAREKVKKAKTIYSESSAQQIMRWVELPADIDASKTSATLKDGILNIKLPKATRTALTKASTA
jgi:HSP20 family molecular chaperone IbpA